jgi:outer membrane protein assembly factor BamB
MRPLSRFVYSLTSSLSLLACVSAAHAENWPEFRGPGRQGISTETNLPLKWNQKENILWKSAIPGDSWSTPIIWGDRVFLTTATEEGQSCRILCLEATSGKTLWDKEVFRQKPRKKEQRNSYATPSPVTDGEKVYAVYGDGSFVAVNFQGEVVWTNRNYPFYSQHGLGASPILSGDLLIMTLDGSSEGADKLVGWQTPWDKSYLVALDTKTGKQRWKTMRGVSRISHGTPVLWTTPEGKTQVVTEAGDVVQGYDRDSGERLWTSEVLGEGKVPSTLVGDGFVFTAGGYRGRESIKAFKLGAKGDLKETNLAWEQKKGTPKVPSMIYVKPYLFTIQDTGIATCIKADNGEVIWQERVGGGFSASPVSAEGRIYLLDNKGETTVIEAGPKFKVLAKNPLDGQVQSSIAISGGRLYLRTDKNLYCIGSGK